MKGNRKMENKEKKKVKGERKIEKKTEQKHKIFYGKETNESKTKVNLS